MAFTCEDAKLAGLCPAPTVQEHCTCSCKPDDDLRSCHDGALVDYAGSVNATDSGGQCVQWGGRDGVAGNATADDALCLSYDRRHGGSLGHAALPLTWMPCRNVPAEPSAWVDELDDDLASQLWVVDE